MTCSVDCDNNNSTLNLICSEQNMYLQCFAPNLTLGDRWSVHIFVKLYQNKIENALHWLGFYPLFYSSQKVRNQFFHPLGVKTLPKSHGSWRNEQLCWRVWLAISYRSGTIDFWHHLQKIDFFQTLRRLWVLSMVDQAFWIRSFDLDSRISSI